MSGVAWPITLHKVCRKLQGITDEVRVEFPGSWTRNSKLVSSCYFPQGLPGPGLPGSSRVFQGLIVSSFSGTATSQESDKLGLSG